MAQSAESLMVCLQELCPELEHRHGRAPHAWIQLEVESVGHPDASKLVAEPRSEMKFLAEIERQLLSWPEVSAHPHRFGGREFQFRAAEIGHVHTGRNVDIPFPRLVRDALFAAGHAEEQYWVPNSGWITYRVRGENDLRHPLWLLRLSYLRYVLKTAAEPAALLERDSEQLRLSPRFKSLFEALLPKSPKTPSGTPDNGQKPGHLRQTCINDSFA
jgi:hypothetical protein